ncbi:MAG: ferric reductase-like transmembrane domain-containing protein [Clostridiaceae bacterium]
MKKKAGLLLIIFSMLITLISWLLVEPTRIIPPVTQYSQLLAAFALVGFTFINFISTRHKILDYLFDGLDKSYIYHKYLSISVLLIIVFHNITISIGEKVQISSSIPIPRDPYAMYGAFSLYLFVILIFIAILAKKLNYERWKNIHKFMLIPYAFGIYHYYGSSDYAVFSIDPFSIWLNIINFIGIISIIYSIFLYEKISFKYRYKVKSLETVPNGTLEITGNALGKNIEFKPGQFAFLKVLKKGFDFSSHPFTISESPKNHQLQFTIKTLGDHTKSLYENLKIGDEFLVSGPHGKFNYETGVRNQIWVAGGIGITPFRSFCQSGVSKEFSIDLFYAYNNKDEGAYIEELIALSKKNNFRLHLHNSEEKGFLSVKEISSHIKPNYEISVYFCGPKPMRDGLIKQFNESKINVANFHFEHFQFK